MDTFSVIVRCSRSFLEKRLKQYDISFNEQIMLMYISNNQFTNQDSIAKNFMTDKGTVAKAIKKLEEKGLILRKENPSNKRENIITLSPKGRDIICYMNKLLTEWQEIAFKDFSKEEIEEMKRLEGKMLKNIAKTDNEEQQ
ncbi:MAG: MarR family transcriptional regulator [Eubacteriaceae bacterium]|nr:MarR family transcriptional regulator [Eubacteriaceae bacterium]